MVDGRFEPVPGTDFEYPADLVLLAMGFTGAQKAGLCSDLGVDFTDRGNVDRDGTYATNVDGVFVAGDRGRGPSLIVWARRRRLGGSRPHGGAGAAGAGPTDGRGTALRSAVAPDLNGT